ncbi:hypothetical protein BCY86_06355 [Pajaroellobacter abortibovis]|uniref:Uncharacterized protein n=1 Tax=Pajaroellobacter abortibovis TaxID=1882918 RepID=A0A1L6MXV0_9BACT|nr:anaerobic C4-dicarboxylate transporter family protein [Pajaroellobacter abortibovis]APS00340.1 hypothetical protein BCY86_06355 [Pajaroellobacter abortibovis]
MWPAYLSGLHDWCLVGLIDGERLNDDLEYQNRLVQGLVQPTGSAVKSEVTGYAKMSVAFFMIGVAGVVALELIPSSHQSWVVKGFREQLNMALAIEMIMLSVPVLIVLCCL